MYKKRRKKKRETRKNKLITHECKRKDNMLIDNCFFILYSSLVKLAAQPCL